MVLTPAGLKPFTFNQGVAVRVRPTGGVRPGDPERVSTGDILGEEPGDDIYPTGRPDPARWQFLKVDSSSDIYADGRPRTGDRDTKTDTGGPNPAIPGEP